MSDDCTCDVTDAMIQRGISEADKIFDTIFEEEANAIPEDNYESGAIIFSLFVNAIHVLNDFGWTTQDLVNEVFNHTNNDTHSGETIQ